MKTPHIMCKKILRSVIKILIQKRQYGSYTGVDFSIQGYNPIICGTI